MEWECKFAIARNKNAAAWPLFCYTATGLFLPEDVYWQLHLYRDGTRMISFDRIRSLPLLLPGATPEPDECYEAKFLGATLVATHTYMPLYGALYTVSFSGSPAVIQMMVQALDSELGLRVSVGKSSYGFMEIYNWSSPSQEIPETMVHQLLGNKQISSICRKHELSREDERILRDILVHFTVFHGDHDARMRYVARVLEDLSEGVAKAIMTALLEINVEFFRGSCRSR